MQMALNANAQAKQISFDTHSTLNLFKVEAWYYEKVAFTALTELVLHFAFTGAGANAE
jgi:hypothetical protein